jgi:hypothetical protein
MGDWLLKLGLDKVAKSLDGYKMYVMGTAFVLKGLLELIGHYWPDSGFPGGDVKQATDDIMIGLGIYAGKSAIVKSGPKRQ